MIEALVKSIHVMCGVVFIGITIASFFYVLNSRRQQQADVLRYALKVSLLGDILLAMIILVQFVSATLLVHLNQLSVQTPWIEVAYLAFAVVSVLWLINVVIKVVNLKQVLFTHLKGYRWFCALHVLMLLIFVVIVHDATTQSTFLGFLIGDYHV